MTNETQSTNAGAGVPPEALDPAEVTGAAVPAAPPQSFLEQELARVRAENERLRASEMQGLRDLIQRQQADIDSLRRAKEEAELIIEAEIAASEKGVANASEASSKERYAIVLDEGQEQDPQTVFVGVNGRAYLIKRGEIVAVPKDVLHVLDNAITLNYVAQKDSRDMPNGVVARAARRFPYAVRGLVVDAEGRDVENSYMERGIDGKLVAKAGVM